MVVNINEWLCKNSFFWYTFFHWRVEFFYIKLDESKVFFVFILTEPVDEVTDVFPLINVNLF